MNNRDYWKERFELLQEKQLEKGIEFYHELEKQYTLAAQAVEKEIISWYNRYATENKVSYTEAKRLLSSRELEEFRWSVEEYIKHGMANNPQFSEQLERASIKFHVSRLEALKLNIQQQIENVYGYELDGIDKLAMDIYNTGYYHTAFEIQKGLKVGWGIGALDDNKVSKAISKPWASDGKNFSARIWNDREKLVQEIHTGLTQNLIRGGSPDELVKDIAKKFQTSKYNASRLVMTESAFFASASRLDSYKECGVEKYQIIETLDTLTCSLCGSLDNKILDIEEYQIGATAPPFHPNCRGTDCAYFDDLPKSERAARDKKGKTYYVPDDMTYPEWKKQFIDNPPEDDTMESSGWNGSKVAAFTKKQAIEHLQTKYQIELKDSRKYPIDEGLLNDCVGWLDSFYEQYPGFWENNPCKLPKICIEPPSSMKDAVGCYSSYRGIPKVEKIALNGAYHSDMAFFERHVKRSIETRWHPQNSTVHGTFVHEFGHHISNSMRWITKDENWQANFITQCVKEYAEQTGHIIKEKGEFANIVSRYSCRSISELFAETFAEYYGGENPRTFSKIFGDKLDKILKELNKNGSKIT